MRPEPGRAPGFSTSDADGGAPLRFLVEERDVAEAVGLTLSPARKAHFEAGPPLARARMTIASWQDDDDPQPFDGIDSIGAFEHFGRHHHSPEERLAVYARFFDFCRRRLVRGGKLSLQTIAYGRIRKLAPFLRERIWRESELPTAHEVLEAACRGVEPERLLNHRLDYARTLRAWEARLSAARARAEALAGPAKVADDLRDLDEAASGFENGAPAAAHRLPPLLSGRGPAAHGFSRCARLDFRRADRALSKGSP